MQALWESTLDNWPYSERALFVTGTALVHSGFFWVPNLILYAMHKNGWMEGYKIQGSKYPSGQLIRDAFKAVALSHLITQWVGFYFAYDVYKYYGATASRELPGLLEVLWNLAVAVAVNDTLFYWAHRLLHHRSIYRFIHKQHHEFRTNVGIASEYAHPVEVILANFIPTFGGLAVVGTHFVTLWIWVAIRILETVDAHSGYDFPFAPHNLLGFLSGASRHDYHHSHNKGCFGAFTIFWDRLCGTDKDFLAWQEKEHAKKTAAKSQ